MRLHGYWRSSASYRVRIALNLKQLGYEQVPHDLRAGAQAEPAFRALNPQAMVPALEVDDKVLIQSPAIIEWLEECYPEPALLPASPDKRAIVRAMAALVACDIHPLNNLRVLKALKHELGTPQPQIDAWAARWIGDGFAALEQLIARHGGAFAYQDSPGLADCYLIPQVYSAERFNVDLSLFPRIRAVVATARAVPAFAAAHPDNQPDAD